MEKVKKYQGKWAVITGASSGIGYELARQFAMNGFDILVTAEDAGIAEAAQAFEQFGTKVESVQVDLTRPDGVDRLVARIKQSSRPVEAIAVNAGVGVGGASFDKTDLQEELKMIQLNIVSVVQLTKKILPDMIAAKNGKILFTSSVAANMPGPYLAVYAATKAFVQSFSEAIRVEMKDKGISVTALQPGPTDTEFFERAHMEDTPVGEKKKDDPADVAQLGFTALMEGRDSVVAGAIMNKVQTNIAKVLPQNIATKMHEKMTKPNSPQNR